MEEGPEPQEWVERAAEHQHHEKGHAPRPADHSHLLPAVTAAVLAVFAAFGALLSGHAANQAILKQTKATDQWAYYQAKSTKGHIYEVNRDMLAALGDTPDSAPPPRVVDTLDKFRKQIEKYEADKEKSRAEAEALEKESELEFHKHHQFALGIASFQVGIVLSSVSILVRYRTFFFLSLVAGSVGLVFLVVGFLGP